MFLSKMYIDAELMSKYGNNNLCLQSEIYMKDDLNVFSVPLSEIYNQNPKFSSLVKLYL